MKKKITCLLVAALVTFGLNTAVFANASRPPIGHEPIQIEIQLPTTGSDISAEETAIETS